MVSCYYIPPMREGGRGGASFANLTTGRVCVWRGALFVCRSIVNVKYALVSLLVKLVETCICINGIS